MCRQVDICVLEVPDVICNDEPDSHIRPEHIGHVLVLGCIEMNASGHAEDVDHSCKCVYDVPPSAVDEYSLVGSPPCSAEVSCDGECCHSGFHVGYVCDHDVGCNDEPWPPFEPFLLAEAPLVLDHHETYTADVSSIKFEVMEPSVHECYCRVLFSSEHTHMCEDEVECQDSRDDNENDHSAGLGSSSELVHDDQSDEDQYPANDLHHCMLTVKLK